MIAVQLNKRDFEYDVHSLIRAFYPGMEVSVFCGKEIDTSYELQISLFYGENQIEGILYSAEEEMLLSDRIEIAYYENRKETKNYLKRMLYRMLQEHTGKELPWGTLTGIRPVKIPVALLEQGRSNREIADHMRSTYLCSNEKTALSVTIANREHRILQELHADQGYSLYVGIPFCPSICLYCSFSSSPLAAWKERVNEYLDALCLEITDTSKLYEGKKLDTVYIGGGTPTTLEPQQMDRLLSVLKKSFDFQHVCEFTVEAGRPDSITKEKLVVLKDHGVTRISINPQTMNQETLDLIGRKHTVEETERAFQLARELGFDNINMDLIVGLPGEGKAEAEHTLEKAAALEPDSITVHSLAVKRAARLSMFKDDYKEMTFINNQDIMEMTARYAVKSGMSPYYLYRQKNMAGNFENVGYAKPGKEGIYNILIMEEKQDIIAVGAGASTKIVLEGQIGRIENVKDIQNYIDRIDEMIERKRQGYLKYGK